MLAKQNINQQINNTTPEDALSNACDTIQPVSNKDNCDMNQAADSFE